jgi:hypothetical protein
MLQIYQVSTLSSGPVHGAAQFRLHVASLLSCRDPVVTSLTEFAENTQACPDNAPNT